MPTQEERLTALERAFVTFREEAGALIRETEENTTILLGVIRSQGQDIKRIFRHIETIDEHLGTMDERLSRLETKSDEHTALLTEILARLPKTP